MRARATSSFEKDFFKLLINSSFGKTMEQVRLRQDIRLVAASQRLYLLNQLRHMSLDIVGLTDPAEGLKLASRPTDFLS